MKPADVVDQLMTAAEAMRAKATRFQDAGLQTGANGVLLQFRGGDLFAVTVRRLSSGAQRLRGDLPRATDRQAEVFAAIETMMTESGYAPTVRELCNRLGLRSSCTMHRHIEALIRKGYIARMPGKNRTLMVLHPPDLDDDVMAGIRREEAATEEMVEAGRNHG